MTSLPARNTTVQTRTRAPKTENAPNHAADKTGRAPLTTSARTPLWVQHLPLQAKLTVNQPGDIYEQEADRVAAQVMRMPDPAAGVVRRCACGGVADETGECPACRAKRLGLQRKSDASGGVAAPPSVHETLRAPGQPLDGGARAFMESRFGHDFGGVRVHTGSGAAASARAVGAQAYTVGQNVVFGEGRYAPGTDDGKRLIAHELAHVVQQTETTGRPGQVMLQRMLACPSTLLNTDPTPSGWQAYHGDPSWFHCGFRGILEDRTPTPADPQNECFYDHSGTLVDGSHPYAGCRGTPNQYDSDRDPIRHTFSDTGGIWHAGGPAFVTSRVYDLLRPIAVAIQTMATIGQVTQSFMEALGTALALSTMTAIASVEPGNWTFQGLPARSRAHLNVMGAFLSSVSLAGNVNIVLQNLTRRLDSFAIANLLDELALDINQALQTRGGTAQQITAGALGEMTLLMLVGWLQSQGFIQYVRLPEEIARERLVSEQSATP